MSCYQTLLLLIAVQVPAIREVIAEPSPEPENIDRMSTPEQELLTKYLLSRLLDKSDVDLPDSSRRDQDPASSILYPQVLQQRVRRPLQKILDQAKENIDVIDFRNPDKRYFEDDHSRSSRQPEATKAERGHKPHHSTAPSEAVPVFLPFPGTEHRQEPGEPANRQSSGGGKRFSMPLRILGQKKYYIGMFFKANWYKAEQYCRFHGMHLASINSVQEQKELEEHLQSIGMGEEHFWTSGTDQAQEGSFFWMSTGKPITYENWNAGEPNNFQYENGEEEHCLELWNRDGKGLRWNDTPCSFQTFFVCEV